MLAKNRVFAIRAGTYTSSDIKEANFNYGYISGDTFKPGGTVAGSAKLTFTSIITSFNKLDKVYPEIGLKVGDSFEWVAMGEYFVNDINIDRNRNTTELDLMDGMFKLNQPYASDLTYPSQIKDVIREICEKTGIELETDNLGLRAIQHHIQSRPEKKEITFREVLSQAIQLLGFSAFFNRKGKLEIRGLTESNITITADNYFLHGLTKSEIKYQIAGITCKKDKETMTVGLRTGRSLELENSFMTQNLLDNLYYDLKEIQYYPFALDWQGHLKLEVGQWVMLKTNKNETYKVPVLSQSFSFRGGLKSKISADSKAGNDTQYVYKGFLGKRIEQMATEIEAEVQQQIEFVDSEFERKFEGLKSEIEGSIEQSKADAKAYTDTIHQEIDAKVTEVDTKATANELLINQKTAAVLAKAGAAESLAQEAKSIGNQAKTDAANAISGALEAKQLAAATGDQISQVQLAVDETNRQILQRVTAVELDPITQRLSSAEATILTQAGQIEERLTSTQVNTLVDSKGYQTASQVQSVVTQTADSLTRTISQIEAKIPTELGGQNLIKNTGKPFVMGYGITNTTWNPDTKRTRLTFNSSANRSYAGEILPQHGIFEWQDFVLKKGGKYTQAIRIATDAPMKSSTGTNITWYHRLIANQTSSHYIAPATLVKIAQNEYVLYSTVTWEKEDAKLRPFDIINLHHVLDFRNNGTYIEFYQPKLEIGTIPTDWSPAQEDLVQVTAFNQTKETVDAHTRTISSVLDSISQVTQTAAGLVSRVSILTDAQNLVYDPTNYSKYESYNNGHLALTSTSTYKLLRITVSGSTSVSYKGFVVPLITGSFRAGEKLSYRLNLWVDVLPDDGLTVSILKNGLSIGTATIRPTRTGAAQIFTGTFDITADTTTIDEYGLTVYLRKNGTVAIGQISIVRGDQPPTDFVDSTTAQGLAISTQVSQLAGSYAIQNLNSAGDLINGINLGADGINRISGKLTRITGETIIDNAVIKSAMVDKLTTANFEAGSVTATIIGAEAVTADKIKVDQALFNKLMADEAYLRQLFAKNAFITSVQAVTLSATKVIGGILSSINNTTSFNLQTGWIDMNAEAVGIRNLWPNYPIQYLVFGRGAINGKAASYTALMSNSKRAVGMNDGSAGIQIWNAMDNTTAVNIYGDAVEFMYNANDTKSIKFDTINNDISNINLLSASNIRLEGYGNFSLADLFNDIYKNLRLLHINKETKIGYSYSMYGPL